MNALRLPLPLVLASAWACGSPQNPVEVAASRELGVLPFADVIKGRDGGYSARFGDRSVWTFGDTILATAGVDGSSWRTSTFTTTTDLDASDGLTPFVEPLDARGAPFQFVPYTAEEEAWNASQRPPACTEGCQKTWVLWPGPVVVAPEIHGALVFYGKLRNWQGAGQGLAFWPSPDQPLQRPIHRPGAPEPTLLFQEGEPSPLTTALVVDGTLYGYGCQHTGFFHFDCILGRVPIAHAQERAAWRFFAGDRGWVEDGVQAVSVMDGASILTVHFNEHLGRYLAVYSKTDNEVRFRVAPEPQGPWSAEKPMHRALAPVEGGSIYDAILHPEFSRDRGRVLYLSYSRGTGPFRSEMRLVEVTLAGPDESLMR